MNKVGSLLLLQCWIPALSHLAGHLLDAISEVVWHRASTNDSTSSATTPLYEMQSWSHLLWAWLPAGRANEALFGLVIRSMIAQQEAKLRVSSENDLSNVLQPQHWSNAIWAVATAQCYNGHDDLLDYVAQLLDEYPNLIGNSWTSIPVLLENSKAKQFPTRSGVWQL
jgi:hypothetical protein